MGAASVSVRMEVGGRAGKSRRIELSKECQHAIRDLGGVTVAANGHCLIGLGSTSDPSTSWDSAELPS